VLVYSIDQDETYEDLRGIHAQILAVHENQSVPMIVVGNKSDLENDPQSGRAGAQYYPDSIHTQFITLYNSF
jgi:GTPase SAR1 family protein